jgi:outer membrane receptor protein involved in Fe transport
MNEHLGRRIPRVIRWLGILGVLSVTATAGAARAHVTTGTILGTVTDETGAALPGATVTITRVETDARRALVSDTQGRYRALALEPGTYEVVIELAGFQSSRHSNLHLALGQDLVVHVTLKLGPLQEQVVVNESLPLVATTSSAVANLVDEKQIRDLPLNGRDFSQLTLLQPGIVAAPTSARSVDRGMGTQVSIAGARPNQISYLLDGADVNFQGNQSPGSAAGGLLGVETVREFQVLTNNYSAEYGRSAGGVISAITRSGTNALRGAAFEFFRHDALDAKNFFDPPDEPIPAFTRHQFGFYVGGPLKRDRTFYFGSFEGLRQDKGLSIVQRVPSRVTRARTDIQPAILPYLLMYPEPNGIETGASGLYSTSVSEPTRENYFVVKADHTFSAADSISVRYSFDDANVLTPVGLPLFSDTIHTRGQFFTLEEKHLFSSRLLNVFRFAWNRAFEETYNVDNIKVDPSLYFLPGTQFGTITVSGLASLGTDTGTPTYVDLKSVQFIDQLTWSNGRHALKTGLSWTYWLNDQDSSFTFGGNYRFNSINDFVRNRTNTFEGTFPGSTTGRNWRQSLIGLFVQDDITAFSRVTLNLGLRYEFITSPRELQDRVASMRSLLDPATTPGYPLFQNPSLKNVAPRVGFAWDVFGDGKTAVRGGGGMFYEPILGNLYRAYGNRTPPYFRLLNIRTPTFPNPLTVLTPRNRLDLVEFDLKNPYRLQYNATLQREVLPETVVTIGYVGSRGIHQIRNIEANQSVPQIQADGRYFFPNNTRANTNFESVRLRVADGNSWYHGLIVGVSKRFSRGLQLQASYTLGKSVDEGSQAIGSADFDNSFQPRYGFDRSDNKGLSDFDVRHNFVFNYSYELPVGAGLTGTAAALARGWQLAGVVTLRSGVPFSPVLDFDRARAAPRSGGAGQRPNWAPGYDRSKVILGGPDQYFDPRAFTLPDAGYFGDVARNALIGPGYASWDAALFRNISVKARRLQIRVEIFNALNRANFALPASTVFNSSGLAEDAGEIIRTVGTSRQIQLGIKLEF